VCELRICKRRMEKKREKKRKDFASHKCMQRVTFSLPARCSGGLAVRWCDACGGALTHAPISMQCAVTFLTRPTKTAAGRQQCFYLRSFCSPCRLRFAVCCTGNHDYSESKAALHWEKINLFAYDTLRGRTF